VSKNKKLTLVAIVVAILAIIIMAWQVFAAGGCSFLVSGHGQKPPAQIVCPADVVMPAVFIGTWRDTVLTVQNTGGTSWTGTIALDPPATAVWNIVSGGGAVTLAPGASKSFTLRFAPADTLPAACRPRAQ